MLDPRWKFAVLPALLVVLGVAISRRDHDSLVAARADAATARREAKTALERAAIADGVSTRFVVEAAQLARQRDSLKRAADEAQRAADILEGQFEATTADAPDTCRTIVATATLALHAKDSVATDLRAALRSSQDGESRLQAAVDTLRPALLALRASTQHLSSADAALAAASKPRLLARLKPNFGFGFDVGVDPAGRVVPVLGVTLSWSF